MVPLLVEQVRDRRSEADVQVTTDVRSAYSGRTQSVRRTGCPAGTPTQGWSSLSTAVVSWTFFSTWLVSQFAPFPQILELSESRRQSHSKLRPHQIVSDWRVGAKFSLSFQVHHYELQLVRNKLVPPPCLGFPSEAPGLRFVLLYLSGGPGRVPWGMQGLFQDSPSKVFS